MTCTANVQRNFLLLCSCKATQNFWHPCFLISPMTTIETKRREGSTGPAGEGNSSFKGQLQTVALFFRRNIPDLAFSFLSPIYGADSKHVASTERYNFINCLKGGCVYLCSVSTGL
jgi:hypothetical protein